MDRNGSITGAPVQRHTQKPNSTSFLFFPLDSLASTPHPAVGPDRNSKTIRECLHSLLLLPHSLSFSIPLLFLSVLRSRISDNDTSWSLSRGNCTLSFTFSFLLFSRRYYGNPSFGFPVRPVQDTRAFSSPSRRRCYSLFPVP